MSNSANTVSGLMWDDIRKLLGKCEDEGNFTKDDYWELTDLINDYGYAMKLAGMRGEQTDGVERVFRSVMGVGHLTARSSNEKYDFGG